MFHGDIAAGLWSPPPVPAIEENHEHIALLPDQIGHGGHARSTIAVLRLACTALFHSWSVLSVSVPKPKPASVYRQPRQGHQSDLGFSQRRCLTWSGESGIRLNHKAVDRGGKPFPTDPRGRPHQRKHWPPSALSLVDMAGNRCRWPAPVTRNCFFLNNASSRPSPRNCRSALMFPASPAWARAFTCAPMQRLTPSSSFVDTVEGPRRRSRSARKIRRHPSSRSAHRFSAAIFPGTLRSHDPFPQLRQSSPVHPAACPCARNRPVSTG